MSRTASGPASVATKWDLFLRFHFQFIYRYPELVEQERTERLVDIIRSGFSS